MSHQLRGKLKKINITKSDRLPCRDTQRAIYDLGGWVFSSSCGNRPISDKFPR